MAESTRFERARTSTLDVAYEVSGPDNGTPVVLLHGFPYDPRAFDDVVPKLVAARCRAIVPYLRGYGPTRFLSADTLRSGQQAALGRDLLDLLDARHRGPVDPWGDPDEVGFARLGAQCAGLPSDRRVAHAGRRRPVQPLRRLRRFVERLTALVTCGGYNIQDIAASARPAPPEQEHRLWYQYYFHTERGRAGLEANRHALGKLLWQLWSPNWRFNDAIYDRTAASFENPDFVDVVIHSYRHRFGYVPGDPDLEDVERRLPILSTYLGHAHVTDTYWYLSACPELMGLATQRLQRRWEDWP